MGYLTPEHCINWVLACNWLQGKSSILCTSFSISTAERNCLLQPWPCWLCRDIATQMDCKEQFVWEELGRMKGPSIQWTEKERREEVSWKPYLVSSLYHSKSGVGTADASHRSKACRPVAASLLLDSVMVGGSAARKHVVNPHTSRWNKTGNLCQGCLPHANCSGYWRSMAAVCCGPCSPCSSMEHCSLKCPSYATLAALLARASLQHCWIKFCHKCIRIHRQS